MKDKSNRIKDILKTIGMSRATLYRYVSPSGELIFYATEHDNDGPTDDLAQAILGNGSVKAGEWRHIDMVRPNSPTLRPSAAVGGPYVVDEGASIVLSAVGRPPVTKAWIQLFEDPDYAERFIVVDYDDREKDNFDDFELHGVRVEKK